MNNSLQLKRLAFTLIEVLSVIVIIAIAAALLFPVLSTSKRKGLQSSCLTQLRQVGMAMLMYQDTNEGRPRAYDDLINAGFIRDRAILLCPSDDFGGFGARIRRCQFKDEKLLFSYESVMYWFDGLLDRLEKADPNHGLLACRLHGSRTAEALGNETFCDRYFFPFQGTLLRFRKDGSVQTAQFQFRPPRNESEGPTSSIWDLFTDEKDPDWRY